MNDGVSLPENSDRRSAYDECRARVAGTTIDDRTLLSTDYFNSFNEIVMLLGMVASMPEVLDDIRAWKFRTYEEHFYDSGLPFALLAIEAYACAPADVRERFEKLIDELHQAIDEARDNLRAATNADELCRLELSATDYARRLQNLIETGSGIVHGVSMSVGQDAIDKIF